MTVLSELGLRGIARYRRSNLAAATAGCCRYRVTCSHYAEDVLRTKSFETRRGSLRAVILLSLLITLGTAGLAQAVRPLIVQDRVTVTQGGCIMTLNGQDIGGFNRNNPLTVRTGQRLVVKGIAPPAVRNAPEPANSRTLLSIRINLPAKSPTLTDKFLKGVRTFDSLENVDKYLKYGSGLYRVDGTAKGFGVPQQLFECNATFYVKLDGNDAAGLIAGGVALVGLAGAATSGGKTDWQPGDSVPKGEETAGQGVGVGIAIDLTKEMAPDEAANKGFEGATYGCLIMLILIMIGSDGGHYGAAVPVGVGDSAKGERIWRRGHPIRGFFSGLLMGLGITVFMQQRGYWLLSNETVFMFPAALALLFGFRGWRGKAFRRVSRPPAQQEV
jgi:hypothetical protein